LGGFSVEPLVLWTLLARFVRRRWTDNRTRASLAEKPDLDRGCVSLPAHRHRGVDRRCRTEPRSAQLSPVETIGDQPFEILNDLFRDFELHCCAASQRKLHSKGSGFRSIECTHGASYAGWSALDDLRPRGKNFACLNLSIGVTPWTALSGSMRS
jgi:hypothetical protein